MKEHSFPREHRKWGRGADWRGWGEGLGEGPQWTRPSAWSHPHLMILWGDLV